MASAVAGISLGAMAALPAHSFEFDFQNPDLSGSLNTSVTAGALWRTQSQDRELAANEEVLLMAERGYSTQLNKNDANNNFDTGLASLVGKITPELSLSYRDYGIFVRGTAFYDVMIMDSFHDGGELIAAAPQPVNGINRYATASDYANNGAGNRFTSEARSDAGRRARFLDVYAFGNFDFFDRPLQLRAGRQVINWGEALFIQNGINTANYIELASLRLPGAELKEALLPLASVFASYGVTLNLTAEAFYQFEWKNTEDAPVGTFFSTHDAFPGRGANNVIVDGRLVGRVVEDQLAELVPLPLPGVLPTGSDIADGFAAYTNDTYGPTGPGYQYEQTQVTVNRGADQKASSDGQFGLAFRYFADQLGGTEFGVYYTRTHAKLPVVGARFNKINSDGNLANTLLNPQGAARDVAESIDNTEYAMVYLDDIDMFGVSFSSNIGTIALSGELAYRPKQPIINEVGDNLIQNLAVVAAGAALTGETPTIRDLTPHCVRQSVGGSCLEGDTEVVEGQFYYAYDEVETFNTSIVSIFNFGPRFGTDDLLMLVELGGEYINGLNSRAADGTRLHYNSTAAISLAESEIRTPNDPFKTYLDEFSWGYRAALRGTYNDIFSGISLQPTLVFAHDVEGNSPLGGNFMENRRAGTLSLNFVYRSNFEVGVSGTTFWGAGYSNKLRDRNNAALTMKYSF
ncbi:MAG: DUF1302 domain-containing protein [Alcanivorax sp.]|nr:DUF1302 domain-containing protein [Alcanivorax sp.]